MSLLLLGRPQHRPRSPAQRLAGWIWMGKGRMWKGGAGEPGSYVAV